MTQQRIRYKPMRRIDKISALQSLHESYLIECYMEALKFDLDDEFIEVLEEELGRRNIDITPYQVNKGSALISELT